MGRSESCEIFPFTVFVQADFSVDIILVILREVGVVSFR